MNRFTKSTAGCLQNDHDEDHHCDSTARSMWNMDSTPFKNSVIKIFVFLVFITWGQAPRAKILKFFDFSDFENFEIFDFLIFRIFLFLSFHCIPLTFLVSTSYYMCIGILSILF